METKQQIKCNSNDIVIEKNEQVDCVMNNTCIFNNTNIKFYTCKQCKDTIGEKICEKCFLKCHQGHEQDSTLTEFLLNIREQHCNCAEAKHTQSKIEQESETCCFKVFAENLKIDQFVELKTKQEVVCYGCFVGCGYKKEEYEINYITKEKFECACTKCRKGQRSGETNLNILFFNYNNEKIINLRKIFKNFINTGKLKKDYEKEILNALFCSSVKSGLIEKFSNVKSKLFLFKIGIKLNQGVEINLLDKEELIKLCNKNIEQQNTGRRGPRRAGLQGRGGDNTGIANESALLGLKGYTLYFIRHILIKPCLKNKTSWSQLDNLSNFTPFQRQIFREKYDDVYYRCKKQGFDLTNLIKTFLLFDFVQITRTTESLQMFVIEYFKWCCMFASFDYRSSEVLEKKDKQKLNAYLLKRVNSIIIDLRRETVILNNNDGPIKINKEKNIQKYVEKFFKTYLIRFNDERFFDFMQDIKDINKVKFFFEKSKKELIQEQKRLIAFQGLFFSKEKDPIVSSECYELLFSYEDSYISTLQTLSSIQDSIIDKVLYNHFINSSLNSNRVSNNLVEKDQIYSNVMNCINNYSNTDMSSSFFYEDIKMSLSLITEKTILFTSMTKVTKKAIEQIKKVKEPCFSILFTIYQLFNNDIFIKIEISQDQINFIQKKVLNLFRLFFDNPIILPFFFTQGSMKTISNYYSIRSQKHYYFNQQQIQFYSEAIDQAKNINYPLDLKEFTLMLIGENITSLNTNLETIVKTEFLSDQEIEILQVSIAKIDLMAKLLRISSKESLMKVNHFIKNYLESIKYINILQLGYFELDQIRQQLYLNIIKVINSFNDYYYYLLSSRLPINDLIFNSDELSNKLLDPTISDEKLDIDNQLIIFIKAVARYYAISHFEVHPSSLERVIDKENDNWSLKQTINTRIIEDKPVTTRSMVGIFSNTKAFSMKLKNEISDDFESKIEILITNLTRFKSHFYRIENYEDNIFEHFEEVILIPSIYIVYDIIAFFPSITSKAKYLVYKVINLFMQSYKFFLKNIITYFLPENMRQLQLSIKNSKSFVGKMYQQKDRSMKIMGLLLDTFIIQRKNEDLKIFFQNIHDCLNNDLVTIEKDPLNLKMLFTKFIKYVTGLKRGQFLNQITLPEAIFFDFHNKINTIEDREQDIPHEIKNYKQKLNTFVETYLKRKEDNDEHNKNNNLIYDFINKIDENDDKLQYTIKLIVKDLIGKIYLEEGENVYNERFFSVFDYLNRIFIINPSLFQDAILEFSTAEIQKDHSEINDENNISNSIKQVKTNKIINYIKSQLPLTYQLTFIDYYKLNSHIEPKYKAIDIFVSLLEFIRLLCENHNQIFQMQLASEFIKTKKLLFFIIQIPSLTMNHFAKYKSLNTFLEFFKLNEFGYFKPLISQVIDFNIELIQGSKAGKELIIDEKLNKKAFNYSFEIYIQSASRAFEDFEAEENVFYLSQFYRFIVSLFEEYSTKEKHKKNIINHFNLNKMISFFVSCTKELYRTLPNVKQIPKTTEHSKYLIEDYMNYYNDYFKNNPNFIIAFSTLKYLTIANSIKSCNKVHEIINDLVNVKNKTDTESYNNWKYESYKFFQKIMKTVEVSVKFEFIDDNTNDEDEENEEKDEDDEKDAGKENLLQNIFLVHPNVLLLSEEDYKKFESEAPYEDEATKLTYMIDYLKTLESTIKIRISNKNSSEMFKTLSKIDYINVVQISVVISSITALFILFSSYYETSLSQTIDGIINETNAIRIERNEEWIFYIGLAHLLFLFSVMCNWVYFEIELLENTKEKRKIATNLFVKSFMNTPSFLILWSFFWGILAVSFVSCHFGYSLQLFAIFGLFETMKTVVKSVQMRYMQFLSAGLLIIIFSLFFSGIKFYWFCDELADECQQYLTCFVALLTNGIRAGNGVGFAMKVISEPGYFTDFFIEWLFYFSVILILLNVINGIIVDTFQEQREKANEKSDAKANLCYICNTNRSYFERNGQDYDYHIKEEHSIKNYFEYLLTLLKSEEQDLNSIDSSILKQLLDSQTHYFPSKKDKDSK